MSRVKAIYRSWAIPCTGKQVYAPRHRAEWLGKITEPGCAGGLSFTTNNSMHWGRCVGKCGGSCWRRARSTRSLDREARPLDSCGSSESMIGCTEISL